MDSKKLSFLDYTGKYSKINEDKFAFYFKGGIKKVMTPLFIVPPIFDVTFKTVFSYDETGMINTKDFFNTTLFPSSQSVSEIKSFTSKEILSKSNIKHNKGTKIVDNVFIAKFKEKENDIVVDFEMENGYNNCLTEKYFDYDSGLRRANNFAETWVIALCTDKAKNPRNVKTSFSHMIKKYQMDDDSHSLDYIRIFEIYLNDLYNNIDGDISIFKNQKIKDEGKEWIKLFTIHIWSKFYLFESNYVIPSGLIFKNKNVDKVVNEILSDIQDLNRLKIDVDNMNKKRVEEENNKKFELGHKEGYQKGIKDGEKTGFEKGEAHGYKIGEAEGYEKGEAYGYKIGETDGYKIGAAEGYEKGETDGYEKGAAYGFNQGIQKQKLEILDLFFNNYIQGRSLENIQMIGKISSSTIISRYSSNNNNVQRFIYGFIQELSNRNLLI